MSIFRNTVWNDRTRSILRARSKRSEHIWTPPLNQAPGLGSDHRIMPYHVDINKVVSALCR